MPSGIFGIYSSPRLRRVSLGFHSGSADMRDRLDGLDGEGDKLVGLDFVILLFEVVAVLAVSGVTNWASNYL